VDDPDTLASLPVRQAEWIKEHVLPRPVSAGPFGTPAEATHPALQTDVYQEIVNKLAWCLGSVYRVPYSGKRTAVRIYAERIAQAVVRDHGYPVKIAKS